MKKVRVLIDINHLPSEYKDMSLGDVIEKYDNDFDILLIPYDSRLKNTQLPILIQD